ncbi:MAG TPA: hypothetical protein VGB01_00250 [candidate division Zixibacteria bacterium]
MKHTRAKNLSSEKGLCGVAGFLSNGQFSFLKNELKLFKRISGIERDVLWIKRIIFALWVPILLNLALNFLRQ